ncbi:carboxypeptidase B-like [Melitaea cinxia]|uniref:carboxypeptidase B-like n=1 Tax=Melitaea cinxia TaxID=113334 RepID=UPI001E27414B|nr:carboxypeptidase B-like [Melitaea cinxia]
MKFLTLVLLVAAVNAKHEIYIGWKSYIVKPDSYEQLEKLGSKIPELELDFVSNAALNREGVVLVKPQYQADFLDFLTKEKISHRIHVEDLKAQFDLEDKEIEEQDRRTRSANGARIPYDNYQTLEVIYEYIDRIAAQYPETVTLVENWRSFEGRPLKYLKISRDNFQSNKPIVFIDGGMHAREWISPPAVTYAIHKLVENVTEPDLLDKYDWILYPVANPDGYAFTHTNTRMWRKTRSTDQSVASRLCPGADGNRNFNFAWNTVGTSNNRCSDIYAGSRAFSEVEVRAVDAIMQEYRDRIDIYITMHSFGSMILYPWGHDGTLSENAFALQRVGIAMAVAIDELSLPHFPNYVVGNSVLVIGYAASGAAEDYAHSIGIPLTYTYELPGISGQGFHLNPRYIHQVVRETWAGLVAGARAA